VAGKLFIAAILVSLLAVLGCQAAPVVKAISVIELPAEPIREIAPASEGAVWDLMRKRRPSEDIGILAHTYDTMRQKAAKHNIRFTFLAQVVDAESRFNPRAKSRCGAVGLMQIMPENWGWLGITDPTDPEQSLEGGCRYLSGLLRQYRGNEVLALLNYNAGPRYANRPREEWPLESRGYISRITAGDRGMRRMDKPAKTTTTYIVRRGDTLWRIAQRFGTRVGTLAKRNGIRNVNLIRTGQRLVIP
jgi:soluble lytic murein transglycosylase-like protein